MGQNSNAYDNNNFILNPEIIKKHIPDIDEKDLYELSSHLYEFTKLILDKIKNESKKSST